MVPGLSASPFANAAVKTCLWMESVLRISRILSSFSLLGSASLCLDGSSPEAKMPSSDLSGFFSRQKASIPERYE